MLAEERRKEILEILKKDKVVKALTLVEKYNVGVETIRRDFDSLEKKGLIKKIYGGASFISDKEKNNEILEYDIRKNLETNEKNELVKKALNFINEDDSIFLNDGSTNLCLAREIKNKIKKITIITNSLPIASELSNINNYQIILAGGFLNNKEQAFFGSISENIISQFIVNKAFLSVSSISLNDGITDFPLEEVSIQKTMINYSKELYVLANSKKFETSTLMKVTDLQNIKAVITDSNLSDELFEKYKKFGINIIK